ncbi:Serine/threonine-protein phosphatase 4 regulatory subunit 1 [Apophysomyces sp. BC1034]|nr:Serine/threonine-protein phosphatase 4 regulatory subunit 1 [Apophysomyces sp. BC1015]KAG0181215.1 Serine/threonine-protein phosphatase 4 regulatory subunit 1 [Apophysomyces sp. BC1021]KAG0190831.1 Serine/threonine-protein phosphatase 4 regulatory subunit 1 [Apophysomyces sp. BC1034]
MADLGFDFPDEQDYNENMHDAPFTAPQEPDKTTPTVPVSSAAHVQQEAQVNGVVPTDNQNTAGSADGETDVMNNEEYKGKTLDASQRTDFEREGEAEGKGEASKLGTQLNDTDSSQGELRPFPDDLESHRNTDEGQEFTTPDEYSENSLLQAMSEEVSGDDAEEELIMDESLAPMERLYMFNKSDVMIHRLLVAKELPNTIHEISVSEAVNYVLPMVLKIGNDPDDTVRETFVSELDKIILYYYENATPLVDANSRTCPLSNTPQGGDTNSVLSPSASVTNNTEQEKHGTTVASESSVGETLKVSVANDENGQDRTTDNEEHEIHHEEQETTSPVTTQVIGSPTTRSESTHSVESNAQIPCPEPTHTQPSSGSNLHIPTQKFAPLLIEFLLDQNSNLASLAQQCIVSVASELAAYSNIDLYTQLLEIEIFEGIVMGLMSIVDGKQFHAENDQLAAPGTTNGPFADDSLSVANRRSSTPGFEEPSYMHHQTSADDVDQSEINLAKMMCLSLISALAGVLGPKRCKEKCLPIVERLSNDQMFYVRKEAAAAIGSLATAVEPQVTLDSLLPLYLNFSRDTIWHVRRSCVLALPLLCAVLPDDIRTRIAVEGVDIFKNDVSRNVRNTLAEIVGELIAKFLPEDWETTGKPGKVPKQLLEFFLSLSTSPSTNQMFKLDTDRTIICAFNFPAVVLTAGAEYWDSHLKDTYLSLTKDYQIKVRRTFAYSLHEIARIIGPERTERDLVQIFALYLMDLDDVKQGVIEHLAEFLGTLAVSSRNEYIPILAEVWDGVMTNWRLRDILAAQLRGIAILFDAARVVEHILPLAIRACHDEFAAVRETGVESFPVILDIVKRAVDDDGETLSHSERVDDDESIVESKRSFALALLSHVMEKLDEFVRSEMYRNRLVFAQICKSLLEAGIYAGDFASFFLPRLAPLAYDPIVNVRIAASRAIKTIYMNDSYQRELSELVLSDMAPDDDAQPGRLLDQTLYRLAWDKDADVHAFVIELVDSQRLHDREQEMMRLMHSPEEEAGTPMQDIEGPTSPPNVDTTSNEDLQNNDSKDEEEAVGTPMDYSTDEDDGLRAKHDDDGDEMMAEASERHDASRESNRQPYEITVDTSGVDTDKKSPALTFTAPLSSKEVQ